MSVWQITLVMEAQKQPGFTGAPADRPVPTSSLQPAQGSSDVSQGSGIPQQEQALSQPVYLKALTIPLYQPVQAGCLQPNSQLVAGRSCVNLDSGNVPLILNPLVPSEATDQPHTILQKQLGQTLTLNIVSTLPVLPSPHSCVNAPIGSPGKSKKAGKYICKHCGRDCLKPSVLEKHIRSHTGERPFPCTTCGIAFKTQSNLYKHRRTQTHVNNTRVPSDSDNSAVLEHNEKSTESITSHQGSKLLSRTCEDKGAQMKQVNSETSAATETKKLSNLSLRAKSNSSSASENQELMNQSCSSKANQGGPEREPQSLPSPGALPNNQCQRKKMQEQRTPTANKHIQLQRQQATSSEKQWDYKPFDCKLKKCESTDSGYLSRSDSTEQQMASPSPLHSLYEHSMELETETACSSVRGTSGSSAKLDVAEKATALMLEKKRLEEHISKLISHNKSVVDDTQLDNVRPRKTVLSKQGSIDLPMPYTYKDSFHFDIRTGDVNRKKNLALCSAKSTFAPLEKCKPVLFHSVPTQFSTTIDAVPVTRSNSLPFVEGTRMVHDKAGCSNPLSLTKQSVNTGTPSSLPSNTLAANSVDFPNSHPRALVRQTAVDDLPPSNAADHPLLSKELQGSKKLGAGEVISAKNKKHNQRKLKMFSQEKWQMYGDETFKKIYQKMKSSQNAKKIIQRGNKVTDITSFTPDSKESVSSTEITEEREGRSSVSSSLSSLVTTALNTGKSESCTTGNHILQNVSSGATSGSLTYIMETSHSVNAGAHAVMSKTSRDLSGSDTDKCPAGNSTSLTASSCELRLQNAQSQLNADRGNGDGLPVQGSKWEKPSPREESGAFELGSKSTSNNYGNHSRNKESGPRALALPWVHCHHREAAGKSQNLPSERKKLRFEAEKTQNMISNSCLNTSGENKAVQKAEGVCGTSSQCLSTAPLKFSTKAKEQKVNAGINESTGGTQNAGYMKTIKLPTKALNYSDNLLSLSAGITKASSVGFLGPELRGSDCNSFALHNATDKDVKTHLVKTGAKVPLFNDDAVEVSSKIHHLQSGCLPPVPQQNAFSPKYILKLPQDKRALGLSLLLRSEQKIMPCTSVTDTLSNSPCSSHSGPICSHSNDVLGSPLKFEVRKKASKGELQWDVDANWKTPVFCAPVNSETTNILSTADNTFYNPNFRQQCIIRDAWKNKENKNKLNYQRQTEEKWMSLTTSSIHTPNKKICFTSIYTSGFFISADIEEDKKVLHHLCSGSDSLVKTSASCKDAEPAITGWDRGGSPCIPKDTSPALQDTQRSQSSTDNSTNFCHPFGTFYCHALTPHSKEFPVPQDNLTGCSGNLTGLSMKSTFPSLNAEPQLTWCCLTRSLPLPAEQKGNADSAYSSVHTCDKEPGNRSTLANYDISVFQMKNISKTVAYGFTNRSLKTLLSSFSTGQQELSSAAPGGAFKNISKQKKKTVVCKKETLSVNKLKRSHKQKKIKVTPRWYRGRLVHGYAQLRINRLSKQHCFPNVTMDALKKGYSSQSCKFNKKCHSPQSKVQENYLHQQKDTSCSTSDKPLCRRKKEVKNTSGISAHTENLNHVKQEDKMDKQDISGQIREHTSTNSSFQNTAPPLDMPMSARSFSSPVNAGPRRVSSDVGICCPGTQPLVLHQSVPVQSQPNVQGDSRTPSCWSCPFDFTNASTGDQLDSTNSETTGPLSSHAEAWQENTLNVESESQRVGPLNPVIQTSGREKSPNEENTNPSPNDNAAPSSQPGCSRLAGSQADSLPESVTGAELPSAEYTERANIPQKVLDLHGGAEKNRSHLQPQGYGRPHQTVTTAFKKLPVTLRSTELKTFSATSSKMYKKKGLEMMRKQTRLEYDDTSSDDEDRLVIEI